MLSVLVNFPRSPQASRPLSPCPRSALADIPNMKIFHILQDNLLVPEIVRIWESAQDTKNSSQGPLEALHHLSLRWPATQ